MIKNSLFVFIIGLFFFNHNSFADSPLTSTDIYKAYEDSEIIDIASKTSGKLTIELMNYLYENKNPIELKLALISKLGWDFAGKNNSTFFYNYLKEKNNYKNINEFLNQADGDIIICMAYLKALDNYFDVDDAILYARKAKSKNTKSYAINIICALIEAQRAMDSDWCEVYNLTNNVRQNKSLNIDMKEDAIKIIFDYMDNYKDYCK